MSKLSESERGRRDSPDHHRHVGMAKRERTAFAPRAARHSGRETGEDLWRVYRICRWQPVARVRRIPQHPVHTSRAQLLGGCCGADPDTRVVA